MGIYTKTGDKGKTGLFDGTRVKKSDMRLEAYGTVDELVSAIALSRSFVSNTEILKILGKIEEELFMLASELATVKPELLKERISQENIKWLEDSIDFIMAKTSIKNDFIVPGPYKSSASLHLARTIARRAERQTVKLNAESPVSENALIYLNRLSDVFFALAKYQEEEETIKKAMEKIGSALKEDNKPPLVNPSTPKKIDLGTAKIMIGAAEREAQKLKMPMAISVADESGNLIALHRMDGALLASVDISINKANTSVAFKMPTSSLDALAKPGGELYGINTLNDGKYVTFGGGFPVFFEDEIIGAIGVSGGFVEQDEIVAKAGLRAFTEGS